MISYFILELSIGTQTILDSHCFDLTIDLSRSF